MPYSVGERGSYGCSGYPVVKDGTSDVMGCHDTAAEAATQIAAIGENETYEEKEVVTSGGGVGLKNPQAWPETEIPKSRKKLNSAIGQPEPADYRESMFNWSTPVRKPERSSFRIGKAEAPEGAMLKEGDFVMGQTSEGIVHGRVEHIMWEGGILGSPEGEYALESMPPENPAMSVRIFEEEDEGYWEETAYSIGMMYKDAQKLPSLDGHTMGEEKGYGGKNISKAETYSPTSGMKAAARRAIKWKEEGKATGAGTPVGWGRARDIVAGRSMSLSVVKRMYSFFSRHEVDKKGKDFYNTSNPSNGRIMWDAWGGDAGFSWSRQISQRESNKSDSIFSFGSIEDLKAEKQARTEEWFAMRSEQSEIDLVEKADSVRVGQMVSWNSSGGTARGKVKRIIRNGSYNVPGTDFTITGTPEDPAAVITLYRDGEPTDTIVGHKVKTLRVSS
jgi:hypothetical protein